MLNGDVGEESGEEVVHCGRVEEELACWRLEGVVLPWVPVECWDEIGIGVVDGSGMAWHVDFDIDLDAAVRTEGLHFEEVGRGPDLRRVECPLFC